MNDRRDRQFRARVNAWATKLKVQPTQVRLQTMTRKWASCSTQGRVTFSSDLLQQPRAFREYVIVHELVHLRIPNHGKLFHATVAAHLRGNRWIKARPDPGVRNRDAGRKTCARFAR